MTKHFFREQIIQDDKSVWYDDPITNALLSEPAQEKIGMYRKKSILFYPLMYDKYVLWDTRENTVREFDKQGQLNNYCRARNITLPIKAAR